MDACEDSGTAEQAKFQVPAPVRLTACVTVEWMDRLFEKHLQVDDRDNQHHISPVST